MPYYVRAFCTDQSRPSLDQLETALKRDNPEARFETDDDRTSTNWAQAEFHYKDGKQPIIVEINVNDGNKSLVSEESQEFADKIGKPGFSLSKRRVLIQLANTRYIVCCQLLGDIDDDGYYWNGELLKFYVNNHDGMIQADGEGFYYGQKNIVRLY